MTYKRMFYVISIHEWGKRRGQRSEETIICTEDEGLAKEMFEKADARKCEQYEKVIMFSRLEGRS